jgi:hypothetical protein
MKQILLMFFLGTLYSVAQYDNSEKFTFYAGVVTNGPDEYDFSDSVYGLSVHCVYDALKMHEGALGVKVSSGFGDGFKAYYLGPNIRFGSRFFLDMDLLFGYKEITNLKLLKTYPSFPSRTEYKGTAFLWDVGFGFRFSDIPLVLRGVIGASFATGYDGVSAVFGLHAGYRFK